MTKATNKSDFGMSSHSWGVVPISPLDKVLAAGLAGFTVPITSVDRTAANLAAFAVQISALDKIGAQVIKLDRVASDFAIRFPSLSCAGLSPPFNTARR
jgi:hypothetical protein